MKKILSVLLTAVMLLTVFAVAPLSAGAVRSGDFTYVIDKNNAATITGYSGSAANVTIPATLDNHSVITIGDKAFAGNQSLTGVSIPTSVTKIGYGAFADCASLTEITIPNSVKEISDGYYEYVYDQKTDQVVSKDGAFEGCTSLRTAKLGNKLTKISDRLFLDCYALTSVSIPSSVTAIGECAFEGCESLAGITIPGSVKTIGDSAFAGCISLKNLTIPKSVTKIAEAAFFGCISLDSVAIPNSVSEIEWGSFACCSSLKSISIPKSVTYISSSAFSECNALEKITVDAGNQNYNSKNNCNAIIETSSGTLLLGCKNTVIPNTVAYIARDSFYGCDSLTSIVIPDSVKLIGGAEDSGAFSNCTALKSVQIGKSVSVIGEEAFLDCPSLKSVTIPATVTSIGAKAFGYTYTASDYRYKTIPGFTIYGYKGSAAETYATKNKLNFSVLTAPVVSTIENTVNGVSLSWGKIVGANKYRVFIKNGTGWKRIGDTTGTSFVHTGAASGTKYTYTVRCVTKDGTRYISKYNKTGWTITYVAAPALPTVKNTSSGVQVNWKKVKGATMYRVCRKVGSGKWVKLADTSSLSYVDKSAKNGVTYYYTIRCMSKDCKSYASAYIKGGTKITCKR